MVNGDSWRISRLNFCYSAKTYVMVLYNGHFGHLPVIISPLLWTRCYLLLYGSELMNWSDNKTCGKRIQCVYLLEISNNWRLCEIEDLPQAWESCNCLPNRK